jgi:hypothetical protein
MEVAPRKSSRRWEDNIGMGLKRNKLGGCGMDSTGSR